MKVILTQDVYKHGVTGEVVNVSDGFARNWLIPKKMAIPATQANLQQLSDLRAQAAANRAAYNEKVNEAARQIDGVELVFGMKAGSNNKLYGSITSQMIKDALLKKTGLDINRRRISERPIRELGRYDIPVRMGEVSPTIHVVVLREEEVGPYLAAQAGPQAEAAPAETAAESGPAEGTAESAPAETAETAE
jgi:large subunit ribosomal protein L9